MAAGNPRSVIKTESYCRVETQASGSYRGVGGPMLCFSDGNSYLVRLRVGYFDC